MDFTFNRLWAIFKSYYLIHFFSLLDTPQCCREPTRTFLPEPHMSGIEESMVPSPLAGNPALLSLSDLDASRPSVSLLGGFSPFDRKKLDKERAN